MRLRRPPLLIVSAVAAALAAVPVQAERSAQGSTGLDFARPERQPFASSGVETRFRPSGEAAPALDRVAQVLADQIVAGGTEGPIAVYVRSDSAPLAGAFSTVLCGSLARHSLGPVALEGPDGSEAAARKAGARALARIRVELEHGRLVARGDLFGLWRNFWSGATATRPPVPAAALAAALDADAPAIALAAPSSAPAPGAGALELIGAAFATLPAPSAALATGDLDGDGKAEVAALTDEELILFSPQGQVLGRWPHRHLPPSPSPCREPFGAVALLQNPPRVAFTSARRAAGEALAFDRRGGLRSLGTFEGAILGRSGDAEVRGMLQPGLNSFAPELVFGPKQTVRAPAAFTTASFFGGPERAWSLWVYPDGRATLMEGGEERAALTGLGAGSALADLDGDGRPELVTSSAQHLADPDELRVRSIGAAESTALWKGSALRGSVLQIAPADLDGDQAPELVLGVWLPGGGAELQVFRRAGR